MIKDPTLKECLQVLRPFKGEFLGDRDAWKMDVCVALYGYASTRYSGQWSNLYAILGVLINAGFRPSPIFNIKKQRGTMAWEMYKSLKRSFK